MVQSQNSINFEKTGFTEFTAKARSENKLVMIYFTGTGCSLCVQMEKQVFPKSEIKDFFNKSFINVESFDDNEKPDSSTKALRKRLGIVSNPTFIFIDSDGNIIHKSEFKNASDFLIVGMQALSSDNYKNWSAELESGKYDIATIHKFLAVEQRPSLYSRSGYICKSEEVIDNYFASIPENDYLKPENWFIIDKYVANPYSPVFTHLLSNQDKYATQFGQQAINNKIYNTLKTAWTGNTSSKEYIAAETFIRTSKNPMAKLLVKIKEMNWEMQSVIEKKRKLASVCNKI